MNTTINNINWGQIETKLATPLRISAHSIIKRTIAGLIIGSVLGVCLPANASLFTQTLDFTAPNQSVWGSGGTSGFSYSDSIGFSIPLGLGNASVGYSIGANSGTVSAGFYGDMTADYTSNLVVPGTTSIDLSFQGQTRQGVTEVCIPIVGCFDIPTQIPGGQLTSTVGANAELTSSLGNVGPNFTLNNNRRFNPQLNSTVSSSASEPSVAQIPVVDVLAGSAGVEMGVTQTNRFKATAIEGFLNYSLEGSGIVNSSFFSLFTDDGLSLPVNLMDPGKWNFWFTDQTLENTFSTSLDMDLGLYYETFAGCGFLLLESCEGSTNLASINVYNSDEFSLNFNSISNMNGFSIMVRDVPAPALMWFFSFGLIGLICLVKENRS